MGELAREIAPLVSGLVVREVLALPPRDLVLVLGMPGEDGPPRRRLRLSADPEAARVHLQRARFERHEGPLGSFFRRVIEDFTGARLRELTQVAGDRIVALEARDGPSGEPRSLVAELVGRHANLVLLGPSDRVVAVLVPPPPGKEDPRLVPGKVYAPPPGKPGRGSSGEELAQAFPAPSEAAPLRRDETANDGPLSWIVECALGSQASAANAARAHRHLADRAGRKLANARSLVHGLEKKLEASAQSDRVRLDGELLKANLHAVKRGDPHVDVVDFYAVDAGSPDASGGPTRRIELEKKLSPHENLERLFERAKKLERARGTVEAELDRAREKLRVLEELMARIEAAGESAEALEAIEREAIDAGLLEPIQEPDPRRRKEPAPRVPYKVFRGQAGGEIRVGKSAKDNDDLTFHHANGNDVWLHTADTPGSHVVLRLDKGAEPHPEELLDAMHLAVHFSPQKDAAKARVHVARRKEVHKPRGAKPGLVTLSGGKIHDLRMQPERLRRLLEAARAPRPPRPDAPGGPGSPGSPGRPGSPPRDEAADEA